MSTSKSLNFAQSNYKRWYQDYHGLKGVCPTSKTLVIIKAALTISGVTMDDTELLRLANLRCSITILRNCRMAEVWQDEGGVKRPPSTRSSFSDALLVLYECRWMEIWYFKFGQGMELLTWMIWFALEHLTICGCEDRWKGGSLDCREGDPSKIRTELCIICQILYPHPSPLQQPQPSLQFKQETGHGRWKWFILLARLQLARLIHSCVCVCNLHNVSALCA